MYHVQSSRAWQKQKFETRILMAENAKNTMQQPRLRAKAAETRYLVPFCYELCMEMRDAQNTIHNNTVLECVFHLFSFYMTMGRSPYNAEFAKSAAKQCLILYSSLSNEAMRAGKDMRPLKPKFHLFSELAEYQIENSSDPSLFWCYKDEDLIGLIAKIAFSSGGKREAATTPKNVLLKYQGTAE